MQTRKRSSAPRLYGIVLLCLCLFFIAGCDPESKAPTEPQPAGPTWEQLSGPLFSEWVRDMWGSGPNDIFVAASDGRILHYDGSSWSLSISIDSGGFDAVWGSSPHDVFAVGGRGTVFHYDGAEWNRMVVPVGPNVSLLDVNGNADTNVYVVGWWGTVLHYDGAEWNAVDVDSTESYFGVSISPSGNVYLATGNGIVRYDGYTSVVLASSSWWSAGIWAASDSSVFVWDMDGGVGHWNGADFTHQRWQGVLDMWGVSDSVVYSIGDEVRRWVGDSWTVIPESPNGRTLWAVGENEIYTGQGHGRFYRYDGSSWQPLGYPSVTWANLYDVWCAPNGEVFAVGDSGTILHHDGYAWTQMESGTELALYGVWGFHAGDVYAVGNEPHESSIRGIVLHYGGESWEPALVPAARTFSAVHGDSTHGVIVAGQDLEWKAIVLQYDGSAWSEILNYQFLTGPPSVWCNDSSPIYVVRYDFNYRYDGQNWTPITDSGFGGFSLDVWGLSPEFVLIASEQGEIRAYDGVSWTVATQTVDVQLYSVWASSANDIYAVGEEGTIVQYDGSRWTAVFAEVPFTLRGVYGFTDGPVYAVGDLGMIFRYSR